MAIAVLERCPEDDATRRMSAWTSRRRERGCWGPYGETYLSAASAASRTRQITRPCFGFPKKTCDGAYGLWPARVPRGFDGSATESNAVTSVGYGSVWRICRWLKQFDIQIPQSLPMSQAEHFSSSQQRTKNTQGIAKSAYLGIISFSRKIREMPSRNTTRV